MEVGREETASWVRGSRGGSVSSAAAAELLEAVGGSEEVTGSREGKEESVSN